MREKKIKRLYPKPVIKRTWKLSMKCEPWFYKNVQNNEKWNKNPYYQVA